MSLVQFHDADVRSKVQRKRLLKNFIPILFLEEGKVLVSLTVVFCSDNYLLKLNRQYLNHDYYTDILTFDLSNTKEIIGEIYISTDRVKENSASQKISFQQEFERILFHGILHLCGHGDKTLPQKEMMTQKENEAIVKYHQFHVKQ